MRISFIVLRNERSINADNIESFYYYWARKSGSHEKYEDAEKEIKLLIKEETDPFGYEYKIERIFER